MATLLLDASIGRLRHGPRQRQPKTGERESCQVPVQRPSGKKQKTTRWELLYRGQHLQPYDGTPLAPCSIANCRHMCSKNGMIRLLIEAGDRIPARPSQPLLPNVDALEEREIGSASIFRPLSVRCVLSQTRKAGKKIPKIHGDKKTLDLNSTYLRV